MTQYNRDSLQWGNEAIQLLLEVREASEHEADELYEKIKDFLERYEAQND